MGAICKRFKAEPAKRTPLYPAKTRIGFDFVFGNFDETRDSGAGSLSIPVSASHHRAISSNRLFSTGGKRPVSCADRLGPPPTFSFFRFFEESVHVTQP